jgi:hypothetical protein
MRALVLGNSDTAGVFSGGETWTQIVRATLQESDPELVFTDVTFSPLGTQAPGVAAGLVRDHEADLVILPVGTFAFTTTFTALRVRRLLGRRAARLYKRAENRFDNSTRQRGAWRDRLNRTVRRTVRTVVGADPLASPEASAAAYRAVLDALARDERCDVLVVAYPPEAPKFFEGRPAAQRAGFLAEIERGVRDHHFRWVLGDDALRDLPPGVEILTRDGFHFNAEGHRRHAALVLAAAREAAHEQSIAAP